MKTSVEERMNIQILLIIVFTMIISYIIQFNESLLKVEFFIRSFIIYIISLCITFKNVNYLTKEYINNYIRRIIIIHIIVGLIIEGLILLPSLVVNDSDSVVYMIKIFVLYTLKILCTFIFFKIKSNKFISEEEYLKEKNNIVKKQETLEKDEVELETVIKNKKKKKPIFPKIILVVFLLNKSL